VFIDTDEEAARAFEAHVWRVHGRWSPDPDYPIEYIKLSTGIRGGEDA
jgi:hypothetical protein